MLIVSTIFSTYKAVMAADAPSNMFATAMMLLIRHNAIYTKCAVVPDEISEIYGIRVADLTISNTNDFQQGMCFRNLELAGYSQEREEHDHRATSSRKPERPTDAIIVAN